MSSTFYFAFGLAAAFVAGAVAEQKLHVLEAADIVANQAGREVAKAAIAAKAKAAEAVKSLHPSKSPTAKTVDAAFA